MSAGIGLLALAAAMQPAAAADLEVRAPLYRAPPVYIDPWSWTGVYIGLNGGYSWGRPVTDVTFLTLPGFGPIAPPVTSITNAKLKLDGGIFGAQLGFNWQFGRTWVFGVEADVQWSDQKDSTLFRCAALPAGAFGPCRPGLAVIPPGGAAGQTIEFAQQLQWFGTLRGRVGVLPGPSAMVYVTGGLAYGEIKTDQSLTAFSAAGVPSTVAVSQTDIRTGWTVGAGVEGRLWDNWTGKIEYLYIDFGNFSGTILNTAAGIGANWSSSRFDDNILRAGINYKFGGPVIARF